MKREYLTQAGIVVLFLAGGCNGNTGGTKFEAAPPTKLSAEPSASKPVTDRTVSSSWEIQDKSVNRIDNSVTQFVSTTGLATAGSVRLALCFKNGRPCYDSVPAYVKAPCWIDGNGGDELHRRTIRLKFDEDKFRVENWGITDDHEALIPPNYKSFIAELKKHRSLLLEFGCDRSDPGEVIEFDVAGLQPTLDSAKLSTNR